MYNYIVMKWNSRNMFHVLGLYNMKMILLKETDLAHLNKVFFEAKTWIIW